MLVWQQAAGHIQDIRKMMREHSQQFIHKEGIANYLRTRTRTARRGSRQGCEVVLQKVASEDNPKVRNHGEGPY